MGPKCSRKVEITASDVSVFAGEGDGRLAVLPCRATGAADFGRLLDVSRAASSSARSSGFVATTSSSRASSSAVSSRPSFSASCRKSLVRRWRSLTSAALRSAPLLLWGALRHWLVWRCRPRLAARSTRRWHIESLCRESCRIVSVPLMLRLRSSCSFITSSQSTRSWHGLPNICAPANKTPRAGRSSSRLFARSRNGERCCQGGPGAALGEGLQLPPRLRAT
mmetsp:Transcript_1189/g.3776  ORF Transcript_1189/g.3776 Transcript_1189/m.3776 type:complete len:223 (+) Transcript_1189:424-1092(+)